MVYLFRYKYNYRYFILFFYSLILFLSVPALGKELTKEQKIGELSFQLVNAIDMFQTLEIVEHSNLYYETNPILGKHPKNYEVVGYFIARGFLHYEVTKWLPSKFRLPWLTITVLPQIPIIEHNHNLGIRIAW